MGRDSVSSRKSESPSSRQSKKCLSMSSSKTRLSRSSSTRTELSQRQQVAFYARCACLMAVSLIVLGSAALAFPFLFFQRKIWRKFIDQAQTLWVNMLLWILPEHFMNFYGTLPDASNRPKVIICNHQTDVDWIFLWMLSGLSHQGNQVVDRSGSVKIFLKKEVKSIPVVGWGCSAFGFIFLERDWKKDKKTMEEALVALVGDEQPLWLFLFVEGTTMNQRAFVKSREFSASSGRPKLDHLLLPRVRGLHHVIQTLTKHASRKPEIFDMTMCFDSYSGEIPPWESAYQRNVDYLVPNFNKLFQGSSSKSVYIESTRFTSKEYPVEEEELSQWLDERWQRKDKVLEYFIDHGKFNEDELGEPMVIPIVGSVWRSIAELFFKFSMWVGMVFTYLKYKQDGASFF